MRTLILCGLLGAVAVGGVTEVAPMMVGDPAFDSQAVDPAHADQCGWSPPPAEAIHDAAEDESLSTKAPELFQ
jgi:hypothetical protein